MQLVYFCFIFVALCRKSVLLLQHKVESLENNDKRLIRNPSEKGVKKI